MFLINPIIFSKNAFRLIPKVLNAVNVIETLSKFSRMIDSKVFKIAHI